MIPLKQSTATVVLIGPFLDADDGVTPETGLTVGSIDVDVYKGVTKSDLTITASGGQNDMVHVANGFYSLELTATDTNTLGRLVVTANIAGALPVWHEFVVLPANVYDSLVAGSDQLQVDVVQAAGTAWGSGAITASAIASNAITDAKIASGAITAAKLASGAITADKIATDAIAAAKIASDAVAKIQNGLATAATLGTPAGASIAADIAAVKSQTAAIEADTQDLQTQIGAAGAGLTAIPWNSAWDSEVESEVADALASYDPPTKSELDAAVAPLATSSALTTVGSNVDAVKAVTDKLDTMLEDDSGYRFTAKALEEAPAAEGGLTASAIADAVWDEALSDHTGNGTAGEALAAAAVGGGGSGPSASDIADAVLDEALSGHTTPGTLGAVVSGIANTATDISGRIPAALVGGRIDANVGAISGDATAADNLEAAADGTGYNLGGGQIVAASVTGAVGSVTGNVGGTIGGLSAQAKADVNAEVDAALADYDPPTKAEMDSAVAGLATASALSTVGSNVSAIKDKTDQLTFTKAGEVDANVQSINDTALQGDGSSTPWGPA